MSNKQGIPWSDTVLCSILFCFFFVFFFYLGFTALSRIRHLYWADCSSKVGENRRTRGKATWPSVSKTWLSHMWHKRGSNHSGENFFFFFFDLGFTALSRIFHLYRADRSSKVGENRRTPEKNHLTIRKQNLAFPHMTRARLEPQRWET